MISNDDDDDDHHHHHRHMTRVGDPPRMLSQEYPKSLQP
eukprot:CAMPEP_0167789230 /NCGR_PEP_ID=MMETSP0111_2-20121227/10554_1 /TAXON_ID=91324 /ORGANISM="Lotharella globosa, Strain CCCM811" /LENGTH=38 /DNA_ID= /DNA_START= /DNA_END= /DNA_ORIENTATION=